MATSRTSKIEQLESQIEDLKLELFPLLVDLPIGHPVSVFDRWNRVGTLKGYTKVNGQAAIVLEVFTKDQKALEYYCYQPSQIKKIK